MKVDNVYFAGAANHEKSVHEEIDTIVDAAFNNMLKSADVDSEDNESPREADISFSFPSANKHELDGTHERGQHQKEIHGSADVDVTEQQEQYSRLKGDSANDETSWKQWREQHRQMDLNKKPLQETAEAFPQGMSDDDKTFHDTQPMQHTGSPHETTDREASAKSEDKPDSFNAALDEKEMQESSNTVGSNIEEHSVNHDHLEETDLPESVQAVGITAGSDFVVHESLPKTEDSENIIPPEMAAFKSDDQLLKTEGGDDVVSSEVAAVNVESDGKEEENVEKETFHEDSSTEADAVHKWAEGFHESPSYDDENETQTVWRSKSDVLNEATAADDMERQAAVTEDDQMVVKHDIIADYNDPTFHSEEHSSDFVSESDFIKEELSHTTDEDVPEIHPALDSGNVDVAPDDGSAGWTFSALSNIFSVTDAVIDMVRHKNLF